MFLLKLAKYLTVFLLSVWTHSSTTFPESFVVKSNVSVRVISIVNLIGSINTYEINEAFLWIYLPWGFQRALMEERLLTLNVDGTIPWGGLLDWRGEMMPDECQHSSFSVSWL